MKLTLIFAVLVFLTSCEKKSLNEKEILQLIHSKEDYKTMILRTDFSYGQNFMDSIKSFRKIISKENFKPIYKADFNNDGKEDYLLNLDYEKKDNNNDVVIIKPFFNEDSKNCLILLSSKNGYQFLNPGKKRVYDIFSAKIINVKGQNLIKLLNFKRHYNDKKDILRSDTLMIKNNALTEFVKPHPNQNIKKIIFRKIAGYAPGTILELTLKNDSLILNTKSSGKFSGKYTIANKEDFQLTSKYLNEINFTKMKDKYFTTSYDSPAIETNIFYDNGKIKTIYDYGEKGTLSLVTFYEKMDTLPNSKKWQPIISKID